MAKKSAASARDFFKNCQRVLDLGEPRYEGLDFFVCFIARMAGRSITFMQPGQLAFDRSESRLQGSPIRALGLGLNRWALLGHL